MSDRTCSLEDCTRKHEARGLCKMHWKKQYGKTYPLLEVPCTNCGAPAVKYAGDKRHPRQYCSYTCRTTYRRATTGTAGARRRSRELVHVGPSLRCEVPLSHPARAVKPPPRTWTAGACTTCGESFITRKPSIYCSNTCKLEAGDGQRRRAFRVTSTKRRRIYERDGWICQLCLEPVDPTAKPGTTWAASLDHIKCQSWSTVPDHSELNLRLAHHWCNAVRGNESYYTESDLRPPAASTLAPTP